MSGEREWELEGIIRGVGMQAFCQQKNSDFNLIYYGAKGGFSRVKQLSWLSQKAIGEPEWKLEDR